METVNTTDRLAALRELMKAHNVDVYVVPSEDAHHSEYIAPCDGRRGSWTLREDLIWLLHIATKRYVEYEADRVQHSSVDSPARPGVRLSL